ncbi:hypothetical protein [Spongiivirga citrea]|nr:hypothetical protein [Spongiivirga citrea]
MKAQTRLLSPRKLRQESNFMLSGIALTMITIVGLLVATTVA